LALRPPLGPHPVAVEVIVLASGSSGNSLLVRAGGSEFLVDAGLSARKLESRIREAGSDPARLAGILLTHEHSDHASAVCVFSKKWEVPVYSNSSTARAICDAKAAGEIRWRLFETGARFEVAGVGVRSFSVPHDAADPVAFRIEEADTAFAVLTDLGYVTRLIVESLRGVRGMLLETNYDGTLLEKDTRRPWSVKQRITSRHGHLSNADAANLLAQVDAPELSTIILGHLSRDCNCPQLAAGVITNCFAGRAKIPRVHCAGQDAASPVFAIT